MTNNQGPQRKPVGWDGLVSGRSDATLLVPPTQAVGMSRRRLLLQRALSCTVIALSLWVIASQPIGPWTIPVAGVSAAGLIWARARLNHARLREFARYLIGFVGFTLLRHLADDVGPAAYVHYPILGDRLLGLGTVPSQVLQSWLPSLVYPAMLVYTSYFVAPPLVLCALWQWWPDRLRAYVSATLALFAVSAVMHVVLPTAPPWLAARMGALDGVRPLVADYLNISLPTAYQMGTGISANMVAAMPSVHLGVTTLILCALWRSPLRWAAALYLAAMSATVVYTGDHYVVDVLAGMALALVCWRWARS
jgi:hypothetical protein